MKKIFIMLAITIIGTGIYAQIVEDFSLTGEISDENISFDMSFKVSDIERDSTFKLIKGDVAYLKGEFPRGTKLQRDSDGFSLLFERRAKIGRPTEIQFSFASRANHDGDYRVTEFEIPVATVRDIQVICDRSDLDIEFPGAMNIKRIKNAQDKTVVKANLGSDNKFQVRWKPQLKQLTSELAASCDVNTIAVAKVGVLQLNNIFTFNVIQGEIQEFRLDIPKDISITKVSGENIQDWQLLKENENLVLQVRLSHPCIDQYTLVIEAEKMLSNLPCDTSMPIIKPKDMIRTGGFLMLGTDNALKVNIEKASGVTQIDQSGFLVQKNMVEYMPKRKLYAYQYANLPYTLDIKIDNIVTTTDVENYCVIRYTENEIKMEISLELDIKDAPISSINAKLKNGNQWNITSVSGQKVPEMDSDVSKDKDIQNIYIPFSQPLTGRAIVKIKLEKSTVPDEEFSIPTLQVENARSESGYLIIAAEKGVQLKTVKLDELREIHADSSPINVVGVQKAYRFKDSQWSILLKADKTKSAVHCEAFHLISLGEGVSYTSVAFTYHIGGSPLQELSLKIPENINEFEITGSGIDTWKREDDICKVKLQSRIIGDYTLLVTYDGQFDYTGGKIEIGGIESVDTESEVGYLIVSSATALQIANSETLPPPVINISREELPAEYAAPVTAPILKAYKYTQKPHEFKIDINPLKTEMLLTQLADYISLKTKIGSRGGVETTATYFLKNTSRQFLVIKPPAGAKPWHARMKQQDGTYQNIIMQEKDGNWLVPVDRPRDPDQIITVQVTYAQTVKKPGLMTSGIKGITLEAPQLPQTDASFAGWQITVPDEYAIALKSGNMSNNENLPGGLYGTIVKCKRLLQALISPYYTIQKALSGGVGTPKTLNLTRTVNIADGVPPTANVLVVPNWMGGSGSFIKLLIWSILGVVIVIAGIIINKNMILALGAAAMLIAVSESAVGRSAAALIITGTVIAIIIRIFWIITKKFFSLLAKLCKKTHEVFTYKNRKTDGLTDDFENIDIVDDVEKEGYIKTNLLLAILSVFIAFSAIADKVRLETKDAPIVIEDVQVKLTVAEENTETKEDSINADIEYKFEVEEKTNIPLFSDRYVILDYKSNSKYLRIELIHGYYTAILTRNGEYTLDIQCRIPIKSNKEVNSVTLELPENMHNQVSLTIPKKNLNIQAEQAVLFNSKEVGENTTANAVFGNEKKVTVSWQPRQRIRELEKTVIFAEVDSMVTVKSGVLEVRQRVECLIVQGECQSLELQIPNSMTVTSVNAQALATWRFDPAEKQLDIVFNKPQTGTQVVMITTQIAVEGLPYNVTFGIPTLNNVDRQRGAIAVNSSPLVQTRVTEKISLSPMNSEDFAFSAFNMQNNNHDSMIAKTFRYHEADKAKITISAEKVLPEIRAVETSSMSIADDKFEISSRIELITTKAGIFDIDLLIPSSFELETLTGKDVSHWDDMKTTNGMRQVKVNFSKRLEGETTINLLSTRIINEIEKTFYIPKIEIEGARKHTGRVTVIAEKGIRLNVKKHEAVDIRKAKEVEIYQSGALVFDLLRKNWSVELQSEVLNPIIKPEVLQWVDIEEGLLQNNAYIKYKIENAGVKQFQIKCPDKNALLTFTGRGVASVNKLQGTNGIWQVNLNGKVESHYNLKATWQIPYSNEAEKLNIKSLQTIDTYDQRGYLVITCNGRIQVVSKNEPVGLKPEDARNIPSDFGSQDLSDAILCYRTLRSEFNLPLVVTRNDAAKILPAQINNVVLSSVLSEDKKLITSMDARIQVADLNFLKVKLPGQGKLWTVLVNEKEVSVSRENEYYCIPLEQSGNDAPMNISFSFSGDFKINKNNYELDVPTFKDLPMRNIIWNIYVDSDKDFYDFGGNMEYVKTDKNNYFFDSRNYISRNQEKQKANIKKAEEILSKGEQMMQQGDSTAARKAFEQAYNYSLGKKALNEDARVQLRNISKQQIKVGLYNRRQAVKYDNNIAIEPNQQAVIQQSETQGAQSLNFTEEQVRQIEEELAEESDAFDLVADKMIDQQAAASAVIKGLQITLPTHGKHIQFRRDLQITPESRLNVEFKIQKLNIVGYLMKIIALLILTACIFATSLIFRKNKKI
jgi:hypothetical protein